MSSNLTPSAKSLADVLMAKGEFRCTKAAHIKSLFFSSIAQFLRRSPTRPILCQCRRSYQNRTVKYACAEILFSA